MDRWGRALGDCLLYRVPYGYRAPPTGCIEFLAWRVTESCCALGLGSSSTDYSSKAIQLPGPPRNTSRVSELPSFS